MIDYILGFWAPGPLGILFIFLGIPIVLIVLFVRSLLHNKKENIKLRLEVGKLADELEQVRKQKGAEEGDSTAGSR